MAPATPAVPPAAAPAAPAGIATTAPALATPEPWYHAVAGKVPETAQAAAAIVAAYFAWRTVSASRHSIAEQRRLTEIARRERYFRQYLVDPSVDRITAFREDAVRILEEARTASPLLQGAGLGARASAQAADQFGEALYALRERLSFADSALGDTPLWPVLDGILGELEDGVADGLDQLATEGGTAADFPSIVRRHCARVLHAIYQRDLAEYSAEPARDRGRLGRWWAAAAARFVPARAGAGAVRGGVAAAPVAQVASVATADEVAVGGAATEASPEPRTDRGVASTAALLDHRGPTPPGVAVPPPAHSPAPAHEEREQDHERAGTRSTVPVPVPVRTPPEGVAVSANGSPDDPTNVSAPATPSPVPAAGARPPTSGDMADRGTP